MKTNDFLTIFSSYDHINVAGIYSNSIMTVKTLGLTIYLFILTKYYYVTCKQNPNLINLVWMVLIVTNNYKLIE